MFEMVAATPKPREGQQEQQPTQASMRASNPDKIRRNPSTDQRKVRRQMGTKKAAMSKTAWSIDEARQVLTSGATTVDGMIFDHFSASALVQIFDALNPANQAKLLAMPLDRAMDIVWQLAKGKTGSQQHVAALPTATAGEGAYVTNSHLSSIRRDVALGTKARAVQGYVTWIGTKTYDWAVDGIDGNSWALGGEWFDDVVTASLHTAAPEGVYNDDGQPLGFDYPSDPGEDDQSDQDEWDDDFAHEGVIKSASGGDPELWYVFGPPNDSPVSPPFKTVPEARAYMAANFPGNDDVYVGSGFGSWESYSDQLADALGSRRTAGRPGDETFDQYEKDDWSPSDREANDEFSFDFDEGDDDSSKEAKVGSRAFAHADIHDTRPLHSRVAAAFFKKG